MKKWGVVVVVAVAVVALTAPAALAQRGGGGGFGMGPAFLLGQESVQKDLKLSDDQVTKIKDFEQKRREALSGLRDLSQEDRRKKMEEQNKADHKAIAEILKPEQVKRLKQIAWQLQGPQALADEEVVTALGLSADQKDKVKKIGEESRQQMRELFQPGGNREEAQKKMQELRKATNDKMMEVLSPEQKTKLKELTGEPFKGEIQRPGRRGGQR
jgi:Spy/CpxP family protein refolding chaperone